MRFKDLFTVPAGQKITEKAMYRVLTAGICSILLCMGCLAGTTWAWFTVSLENTGNEIVIGEPQVELLVNDEAYTANTELAAADYTVSMTHPNQVDAFQKKSTLYVTLTVRYGEQTKTVYAQLNESNLYSAKVTIKNEVGEPCKLSWEPSWSKPADEIAATDGTITLTAEIPATEPEDATEQTVQQSEPTQESEPTQPENNT